MSLFVPTAIGIDVTDGTLKAVRLARRGRRVELLGCWRIPFHQEPDVEAGRRAALRSFVKRARPGVLTRVVVSAPDRGHFGPTYQIPTMESERVGELVRYEVLSALGLPEEDLLIAHHLRKGVAECRAQVSAHLRSRVEPFVRSLRDQSVPFDDLAPPGWALASFIEHELPSARDRIVLGVGELATTLVLLRDDGVWTRHLPLGLAHAATPEELARRLHLETQAAIAAFIPSDRRFHPTDVVLTEEGAHSGPVTTALKRTFGLPVTRLAELQRVVPRGERAWGDVSPAQALAMGRAYGLALTGLGLARVHGPLVTADDPARAAARRLPLAAASLVVAGLGLAGLGEFASARAATLERTLPAQLAVDVGESAVRARDLQGRLARSRARLDALDALADRRGATFALRTCLAALSEVASARGDRVLHLSGCWLTAGGAGLGPSLELTLEADPSFDEVLEADLSAALGRAGMAPEIRGPEPIPGTPARSRWTLEVTDP